MRWTFKTISFPPADPCDLREAVAALVESKRVAGKPAPYWVGMQVHTDPAQPAEDDAKNWLHRIYKAPAGPAGAVRYLPIDQSPIIASQRLVMLDNRVATLRRSLQSLPASMVARARAAKTCTRTCCACGHSVPVQQIGLAPMHAVPTKRLSPIACPACGYTGFLETKLDRSKATMLRDKLLAAKAARDLEAKAIALTRLRSAPPNAFHWMLGANCPN